MRAAVLLGVAAALVLAVAVILDTVVGDRVEHHAERALAAELRKRTGAEPGSTEVSLDGWLAGLRSVTGPAPDATAIVRGVAVPGTGGRLTRLRLSLSRLDVDVADALGGGGAVPFRARRGSFSAVLDEQDLNEVVGGTGPFGRLELRDGVIVTPGSAGDPATGGAAGTSEVAFTVELDDSGGGDALVLRRAGDEGAGPPGVLGGATLSIPFALPPALRLERVRAREGRLIGTGRVDVERLIAAEGGRTG